MKLPDRITIKLISVQKEIKLNDISLGLILFKSYRNNHHLILPNSDIDGVVTIDKEMMLNEVRLDRSLFLMDYDYHNDFEPEIEISVLTEQEIIKAYRAGVSFNIRSKFPEKYKMLELAENYKVKPKTLKFDIGDNIDSLVELPIDFYSTKSSINLKKRYEDERIFFIAGYGDSKEFLTFLRQKNINSKNRFDLSLLHSAILGNNKEVIDILINNDINLNIPDYEGKTALHYAAKTSDIGLIRKIMDRGGDLSIKDFYGNSAFQIAKIYNKDNFELLELLFDPSIDNKSIDK